MPKMLNNAAALFKYIEKRASIKKRVVDFLVTALMILWIAGFVYIIYLSFLHPGNGFIYVLAIAISSEGIGSTLLVFTNIRKTWDRAYFEVAWKYIRDNEKFICKNTASNTKAWDVLRAYLQEINDPLRFATRKTSKCSLCFFCKSLF